MIDTSGISKIWPFEPALAVCRHVLCEKPAHLAVFYDVTLLSCLPAGRCSGARVAVKELVLWVWICNKKELQKSFG